MGDFRRCQSSRRSGGNPWQRQPVTWQAACEYLAGDCFGLTPAAFGQGLDRAMESRQAPIASRPATGKGTVAGRKPRPGRTGPKRRRAHQLNSGQARGTAHGLAAFSAADAAGPPWGRPLTFRRRACRPGRSGRRDRRQPRSCGSAPSAHHGSSSPLDRRAGGPVPASRARPPHPVVGKLLGYALDLVVGLGCRILGGGDVVSHGL